MQLKNHPQSHLTYCTNIHPGGSWEEIFDQLQTHLPELKRRLSPNEPFGVGLRLSAQAADDVLQAGHLGEFKVWLQKEDLYVFTMNGFPYGNFHGERVKDEVYAPDWGTEKRLEYTLNLVTILAELLPEGMDGGISTSPISYKYWTDEADVITEIFRTSCHHLAMIAYEMSKIQQKQGKELHLDIEPEPDCLLENNRETIEFFTNWLLPEGIAFLGKKHALPPKQATQILQNHIRVCYDTCHYAVEYENPGQAVKDLKSAGIRIGKVQISSALKVNLKVSEEDCETIFSKLRKFVEPVYLHQVIERRADGTFYQYRDLPDALKNADHGETEEWRIHFHVPIFVDEFDGLSSTQEDLIKSVEEILQQDDCRHYEIETYTWEVLPENLKTDLLDSIEREFRWALQLF